MVAVVSGNSLGLLTGSAAVLGDAGVRGSAVTGNRQDGLFLNAATGNLVMQGLDDFQASNGLDTYLTRTYNAQGLVNGAEQGSWTIGPIKSVLRSGTFNAAGSTLTRIEADGSGAIYSYVSAGLYRSTDGDGAYDTLTSTNGGGTYKFVDGATGNSEIYDGTKGGRLVSATDRDNNTTQYRYDAVTGLLSQVEDASKGVTYLNYTNGKLTSVATGRADANITGKFELVSVETSGNDPVIPGDPYDPPYDPSGSDYSAKLVQESSVQPNQPSPPDSAFSTLTYRNTSGQAIPGPLSFVIKNLKNNFAVTNGDTYLDGDPVYELPYGVEAGGTIAVSLTFVPNPEASFKPAAVIYAGLVSEGIATANVLSRLVQYAYDAAGRLESVITDLTPSIATDNAISATNPILYITRYTYDGTSSRVATVTQSDGTSTSIKYVQVGAQWKVQSFTDGEGGVTAFNYDTPLRTVMTDPLGVVTRFDYNSAKQLTNVLTTAAKVGNVSTVFTYDALGNVDTILSPDGVLTKRLYDARGNMVTEMINNGAGGRSDYTYDTSNQRTSETVAMGTAAAMITYMVRDTFGHLRFQVSPEGRVAEYRYDALGNRIAAITYLARQWAGTALPTLAAMLAWTTPNGVLDVKISRTDYAYDFRGQLKKSTVFDAVETDGTGRTWGADSTVTDYVYDAKGQLRQTVRAVNYVATSQTSYVYDGLGRLLTTVDAHGSTSIRYDAASSKIITTSRDGLISTAAYDRAGRLVSVFAPEPASNELGATRFIYDKAGRIRMTEAANGVRAFMLYDEVGNKVADIDANGALVEYRYTAAGALLRTVGYSRPVNTALLLNADGSPSAVTLATLVTGLADPANDRNSWNIYDAQDRLTGSVDALGALTQYAYDLASRLVSTTRFATLVVPGTADKINPAAPAASVDDRITRNFYSKDGLLTGTLDARGYLTEYRYDAGGRLVQQLAYTHASVFDAALAYGGSVLPP